MPLPVAHGLLGASIVAALLPRSTRNRFFMSLLGGALIANAADLDFVLVAVLHSKAWHRGFTHSIGFGLLISLLFLAIPGQTKLRNVVTYGSAFMSHGLLDYLTSNYGGGVQLFWPITQARLTLGLWGLSEVPSQLTPLEIFKALALEAVLFSMLLLTVLLIRSLLERTTSAAGAS